MKLKRLFIILFLANKIIFYILPNIVRSLGRRWLIFHCSYRVRKFLGRDLILILWIQEHNLHMTIPRLQSLHGQSLNYNPYMTIIRLQSLQYTIYKTFRRLQALQFNLYRTIPTIRTGLFLKYDSYRTIPKIQP